jgi:hypothetical protein
VPRGDRLVSIYKGETVVKIADDVYKTRSWALGVMKTSTATAWLRRTFNHALAEVAGPDEIVSATLNLQLTASPFSIISGSISGVNGHQMVERGIMERSRA